MLSSTVVFAASMEVHSLTKVKFTDLKCKKKNPAVQWAQEYIVKTEIRDGILRRNRAVLNALKCGPDFGRLVFAGLTVKIFLLRNILMLH